MLSRIRASRHPVETGLLVALCLFLPLLEAPKNLAWLAYVATWLVNRARSRDFGGRWDGWDTLIALWMASGIAVALFAGIQGQQWQGVGDMVRYLSILWLVKRARYGEAEVRAALAALVVSTLIGLGIGYDRVWRGLNVHGHLELRSVGHVNHTAIYLAIMAGACCAWLFAGWRRWSTGPRVLAAVASAVIVGSLVVTASRGAIAAGLLALLIIAALWWPRSRLLLPALLVALAVGAVAAYQMRIGALVKHERNVEARNVLAFRDGIWRMGLAGWERFKWFGVGQDNFRHITAERVRAWREAAGQDFDPARYVHFPHGHSLYVNTLAERGLVGAGALLAVLAAWAAALWRRRPRKDDPDLAWTLFGAAAAAWTVTVVGGLVNTTLHHEHAILAALLLALWLGRPRVGT